LRACHDIPSRDIEILESATTAQVNANIGVTRIEQMQVTEWKLQLG
jgi:hypothetical protein